MSKALFGEHFGQDGLQLKWVAPTDLFMEFGAELGRGAGFPGTDRNKNSAGASANRATRSANNRRLPPASTEAGNSTR